MNIIRTIALALALLPLVVAAQPAWLNDGLVAYYPLDGDAKDYSGNGYDGSIFGAKRAVGSDGLPDTALEFDGTSWVDMPKYNQLPSEDSFSYSYWVNISDDYTGSKLLNRHANISSYTDGPLFAMAVLRESNGENRFQLVVRGDYQDGLPYAEGPTATTYPSNTWLHVVMMRDYGDSFKVYIDAQEVVNIPDNGKELIIHPIRLGTHKDPSVEPFSGSLDEFRVYDRALSANEVAQLYEYESTPPARPIEEWLNDGLVAYYPFNGDAKDYSGNGNDGEVVGAIFENVTSTGEGFSLRFSADGSSVLLPNLPGSQGEAISVSCWFNTGYSHTGKLVIKDDAKNRQWNLQVETDHLRANLWTSDGQYSASFPTVYYDSQWYHCSFTWDGNSIELYFNGENKVSKSASGSRIASGSSPVIVGTDPSYNSRLFGFKGQIDDVRIYNRALTATEVAQLYAYESTPQPPSNTRKASAMAQIVNGFIVGAEVLDGGYGYSSNPEVTISGGGGFGAVATATVSAGKVVKINIINPGFGYTGDPTIDIEAPPVPPALAFATAEVVNGFLVGTLLVTGGDGYTEPPSVKVTGGNGQGAIVAAEVADGRVVAVNVINPGSGYTTAPVITIAPPPTAPELSIRVTQVEVNMKLTEGKRYTIESSKNMVDWTQTGPLFVAEEQFMAVKFDVDEFGQFFRVIEQP